MHAIGCVRLLHMDFQSAKIRRSLPTIAADARYRLCEADARGFSVSQDQKIVADHSS